MTNLLELDALEFHSDLWHFAVPQGAAKVKITKTKIRYTLRLYIEWWIDGQWIQDTNVADGVIILMYVVERGSKATKDDIYFQFITGLIANWVRDETSDAVNQVIWNIT